MMAISVMMVSCGEKEATKEDSDTTEKEAVENHEEGVVEEPIVEEIENAIFQSEDGKFEINFFGKPSESNETVATEVGDIEMMTFMYEKSATEVYMVAYSDYPSAMVELSSAQDLLEGGKNGAVSSLGIYDFEYEEEAEKNGNPGLRFKGNNSNYYVEYEMYLVGNRLYQVAILRDGSYATPERADAFFSSFALNE